jgi:hypothetical protein
VSREVVRPDRTHEATTRGVTCHLIFKRTNQFSKGFGSYGIILLHGFSISFFFIMKIIQKIHCQVFKLHSDTFFFFIQKKNDLKKRINHRFIREYLNITVLTLPLIHGCLQLNRVITAKIEINALV